MRDRLADGWTHSLVSLVGTRLPRAAALVYRDILWHLPSTSKRAYLTFDDGPTPEATEQILHILERHGAKAMFFLLGEKAEKHPGLVRTLRAAGHGIANHSYSHPDAWKSTPAAVLAELERSTGILEDLTGEPVRFMRPPYGRFTRPMRDWCLQQRQQLTMWDVGPGDYLEAMSIDAVVRQVQVHLRPGSIVVLHDNPRCAVKTPAALDRLLEHFVNEGWSFPSLSAGR